MASHTDALGFNDLIVLLPSSMRSNKEFQVREIANTKLPNEIKIQLVMEFRSNGPSMTPEAVPKEVKTTTVAHVEEVSLAEIPQAEPVDITSRYEQQITSLLYVITVLLIARNQNRWTLLPGFNKYAYHRFLNSIGKFHPPYPTIQHDIVQNLSSVLIEMPEDIKRIILDCGFDFLSIQESFDIRVAYVLSQKFPSVLKPMPRFRARAHFEILDSKLQNPENVQLAYPLADNVKTAALALGCRKPQDFDDMMDREIRAIDAETSKTHDLAEPPDICTILLWASFCCPWVPVFCHEGCTGDTVISCCCIPCWPCFCWAPREIKMMKSKKELEANVNIRRTLRLDNW